MKNLKILVKSIWILLQSWKKVRKQFKELDENIKKAEKKYKIKIERKKSKLRKRDVTIQYLELIINWMKEEEKIKEKAIKMCEADILIKTNYCKELGEEVPEELKPRIKEQRKKVMNRYKEVFKNG